MPREILQIQTGKLGNYVGVHFYNTLDSMWPSNGDQLPSNGIDPQQTPYSDVFYRSSITPANSRADSGYIPRLLSIDLKGARGSLHDSSNAVSKGEHAKFWDGHLQEVQLDEGKMNDYIRDREMERLKLGADLTMNEEGDFQRQSSYSNHLSDHVRYWSDYTSSPAYYNNTSNNVVEINDYIEGDESRIFAFYHQGIEAIQNTEFESEVLDDRIRRMMEECDSAQGFQILVDVDTGFSGLSASLIQDNLCEEYPKKTFLVYGFSSSSSISSRIAKANQALFMKSMMESGVLYVPIYLPSQHDFLVGDGWTHNLDPRFDTLYQASGYVSAAIDTISLPFHLPASSTSVVTEVAQLQAALNCGSESVYGLALGFPKFDSDKEYSSAKDMIIQNFGDDCQFQWARDLTLESSFKLKDTQKSFNVFRGITDVCNRLHSKNILSSSIKECITETLQKSCLSAQCIMFDDPFYLSPTFPQFFNKSMKKNGIQSHYSVRGSFERVESCPIFASLYSGRTALNILYSRMLQNVTFKAGNMADEMLQRDLCGGGFEMGNIEWHEVQEHFANLVMDEDE